MANVIYALLLIFSGFSVGCACVGAIASYKVSKLGATMAKHAVTLLVGIIITQGTLLFRLIQVGFVVEPTNAPTLFYTTGLVVQSVGLLLTTNFAVNRLAEYEVKHDGDGKHVPGE